MRVGGKVEDGELIWEEKGIKEEIRTWWKDDKMQDSNGVYATASFCKRIYFYFLGISGIDGCGCTNKVRCAPDVRP